MATIGQNLQGSDHPFDGLIVGFVQWIAGSTGHQRSELSVDGNLSIFAHDLDALQVALDAMAKVDKAHLALFIDDGIDRVGRPEKFEDFELATVQGVFDEVAVAGQGIGHELVVVESSDGLFTGHARSDDFATTGVAGHEVGFDQPDDDPQIGVDQMAIEQHRYPIGWGLAQIDHPSQVAGVVIFDADVVEDPLVADDFEHFFAQVWAVQAGGNQDGDLWVSHAGGIEFLDDPSENRTVGDRAGNVANHDADPRGSSRNFLERWACDPLAKRLADSARGIVKQGHGGFAHDHRLATFGKPHR